MKKKRIIIILSIIIVAFLSIFLLVPKNTNKQKKQEPKTEEKTIVKKYDIDKIQADYNNEDIIAYINIPNVLETPIAKGVDNDYYLNHDLYKNDDYRGTVEMDFRNTTTDKKILIYGHSGEEQELPFLQLNKYIEEQFYRDNPYIYLYTKEDERKYKIISSYIETEDFDYVNLISFNGLTYKEHVEKLKNKSLFPTDATITEESNILILQTCSMNNRGNGHYHLIIGLLEERNTY